MAMADHSGQVANDAARLEAALERLGRLRPPTPPEPGPATDPPNQASAELAGRLDALIAELRATLGSPGAD
jgi:hypothetical protein